MAAALPLPHQHAPSCPGFPSGRAWASSASASASAEPEEPQDAETPQTGNSNSTGASGVCVRRCALDDAVGGPTEPEPALERRVDRL